MSINYTPDNTFIFTLARMNPPTPGHLYLIRRLIQTAIDNYNTIEDYIDFIFEKDVTTKYKPKQKGMREIEFEENNAPLEIIEEEVTEPKKRIRKLNTKKMKSTIILEEEEEPKEVREEQVNLEEIFFPRENIDISPVKNKTRKKRKTRMILNTIWITSQKNY